MDGVTRLEDREQLLQDAKALRQARRVPEALARLDKIETLFPKFSRLYQERGHCYVLLGNSDSAITALRAAVRLNPALPSCWDMLEQLYRRQDDATQADNAAQHLATLKQLPPELVVANSLYSDGNLSSAEAVVRDFLKKDEDNVGALRLLARIHMRHGAYKQAETILESVIADEPDYPTVRLEYAMALLQQQKHQMALDEAKLLLKVEPNNREYLKLFGAACIGIGDYVPVIDLYEHLLANLTPTGTEVAELRLWRANALKITGRVPEAIADYRAALSACPNYGVAWFALANLKTYRFCDDEIKAMRDGLARSDIQDIDRIYLSFALGKALEDMGDFETSWRTYEHGNGLRRASSRYRSEATQAFATKIKCVFTPEFFQARKGWGVDDSAPIFILGLPRSGSTLIEQILASHSQVEGTQELTEIDHYMAELCDRNLNNRLPINLEAIGQLSAQEARSLGERFLKETRSYRRLGRPYFIDKMPNNFWHIGLIQLILPRATIIDMRRDPMSCCFSNLKQLFGSLNQEFTYSINDMAHYYRTYLETMNHWNRVLPGRVLSVQYEDVIEDLEPNVRRILVQCGLEFEEACLAFYETKRSVRTPSSEQVRHPISRQGLDQWRHYAPWLAPLEEALGDALTRYRH